MEDRVILTPKERLQRLSEHLDISVRGLAALTEMSEATLYHITDQTRDMTGRTAARLCYQIERKRGVLVNRDWLLTGKGRMLVDIKPDESAAAVTAVAAEPDLKIDSVNYKEKYTALLEKYTALLEEHTALLEGRNK